MLKILYVLNDTFKKGGTESVVFNYFNHIDRQKIQIDFMIHTTQDEADSNSIYNQLTARGVNVFCVTPRKVSIKKNREDINRCFKENQYDIVHSHTDCIGALILKLARKNGIRVRIAHSHSSKIPIQVHNLKDLLHVIYLEYCRHSIRYQATNYMACSYLAAKWLFGNKNVKRGKVYILHNAIDIEKYKYCKETRERERKKLEIDTGFLLGHVGRFSDEKNHSFILDIFSQIRKRDNKARLLLVGNGPNLKKIKEKSKQMGISDSIIFYGESERVPELLQAMDAFVFPSLYEGLGVVVVEAQASGLPCFVSDCKDVSKESCITDLTSLLPLDNAEKWAEAIINSKRQRSADYSEILKNEGYNIYQEAEKLENYYYNLKELSSYENY